MNPTDFGDSTSGIVSNAYERIQQGEARSVNIEAGMALAETVRTTLGPYGMDKMIVDSLGGVVITNSGATIVQELDIANPAAKMVAEVARSQNDNVGDGTTTGLVLTGTLLREAQDLFEQGLHAKTIVDGYVRAHSIARDWFEKQSTDVDTDDRELLNQIAVVAMTGKTTRIQDDDLVNQIVASIESISVDQSVDLDRLEIETVTGSSSDDTEVIYGVIMEQTPTHPSMPTFQKDARVALIDTDITSGSNDVDVNLSITDPKEIQEISDGVHQNARHITDIFVSHNIDLVLSSGDIDPLVSEYLSQNDILAAEQTPDEGLMRVTRSTDADIVSNVGAFNSKNVGFAGKVEIADVNHEDHFFIEDCRNDVATLLVRGGTTHVQDEIARNIEDAISVLKLSFGDGRFCPGGGALETGAANQVRDLGRKVGSREQLAMEAFANALEEIPLTLAETVGMDSIDTVSELRYQQSQGNHAVGVDVDSKSVKNMLEGGIVEPLSVKLHALETGMSASNMILRIDDIFESEEMPDENRGPPSNLPR